jgi:hypothetical protein
MNKRISNMLLFGTILLLLTACATPTAQPTAIPTQIIENTSTPIVIVVTATPLPATATVEMPTETIEIATATMEPATNTSAPVKTLAPTESGAYNAEGSPIKSESSIIITSIKATASGQAQIFWMANGTFPNGFRLYYSSYIKNPVYGGEKSEYVISDGQTRSAYITGTPGTMYYYRFCNLSGASCSFYSNIYTYTFTGPTPTP